MSSDSAPSENESDRLRDFVDRFWRDHDQGEVRLLDEYLLEFSGHEDFIAQQFQELSQQLRRRPPEHTTFVGGVFEPASDDASRVPTEFIGPYEILGELGRGGQGVVYRARDTRLPRTVALKVLLHLGPAPEHLMLRFRREAEIASKLNHPGICAIIETGIAKGLPYIVMPLLEGEPLSRRIVGAGLADQSFDVDFEDEDDTIAEGLTRRTTQFRSERNELEKLIRLFETIGQALHCAHEFGVVHRDIKPANIFITHGDHPVILDLGLAHMDDESMPALTQSGDVFGTTAYMPPEQVLGRTRDVDRRSDVWSLGVSLYECLTSHRPFQGATRHALVESILWETPADPRTFNASVSKDLAAVVDVALAKDRNQRYQTAEAMVEDLRRVRRYEPILAKPPGLLTRLQRWVQRRPGLALGLLMAFLSLSIGLVVALYSLGEAEKAKTEAETNLFEYERLADVRRLDDLERELAEELWPARAGVLPLMEDWIRRAGELRDRLPDHESAIVEIRKRPRRVEEERQADELDHAEAIAQARSTVTAFRAIVQDQRQKKVEAALLAVQESHLARAEHALENLMVGDSPRSHWLFTDIKDQWRHDQLDDYLQRARPFFGLDADSEGKITEARERLTKARTMKETFEASLAEVWPEAAAAVLAHPSYAASITSFPPQYGLFPLGPDPDSTLMEFAVIGSGTIPRRRSGRPIRPQEDGSVILVLIPGGAFEMGSSDPDEQNEYPSHRVTLAPFFLSKFELSQAQWLQVMTANLSEHSTRNTSHQVLGETYSLLNPVDNVNWFEVESCCHRLALEIPTEAQWEYACAAGSSHRYGHGDDVAGLQAYANILDEGGRAAAPIGSEFEPDYHDGFFRTAPVGSFRPNAFGLHDMHGNVLEWCWDWSSFYLIAPRPGDGRRPAVERINKILRGGDWGSPAQMACRRKRNWVRPSARSTTFGLRPARSLVLSEPSLVR
ncbi:MAG: SUMF1/EgtB/PvdO family nonheme iron enzyme [Planctomycetes bacterium]|nr:SUMF1/EgtB/PvdO family nonheme iron enzyme [Planctomycetota bacterium]